jgi:hypothetical protein
VVTGRGVLSNVSSPTGAEPNQTKCSVNSVLASARLLLVKSGLWCCASNEDENGFSELQRLDVDSPLDWEAEGGKGSVVKEPYFYSADSMIYVRPVALHNFPIYGDHDFAEDLSPDRRPDNRRGVAGPSGSHLGGLAKRYNYVKRISIAIVERKFSPIVLPLPLLDSKRLIHWLRCGRGYQLASLRGTKQPPGAPTRAVHSGNRDSSVRATGHSRTAVGAATTRSQYQWARASSAPIFMRPQICLLACPGPRAAEPIGRPRGWTTTVTCRRTPRSLRIALSGKCLLQMVETSNL